jgi:broad specificity phosphatase PhoE
MVLYVTRHGETNFNAQGRYAGSTDVPLNETGIKQARELAGRLSGMKFDVVVSSPMLRARQTADIVCAELGMEYIIYPQFAERNVGVYEGLTKAEIMERYPDLWAKNCTSLADDAPDGGETLRQACSRIDEGLDKLKQEYPDKTVLLICHGFVARAINRYACNLSFDEMLGFFLKNCDIVKYNLN